MSDTVFEIDAIDIVYRSKEAVKNLSLSAKTGESVGLLGLNGAGKTSTLRALLGMAHPRSGSVRLLGQPPGRVEAFKRIGFAPEDGLPPDYLTGREYLSFIAGVRRQSTSEVDSLLDWFELAHKKKIRDYSKGMRRRIVLAQALLGQPRFLILDEPLNGLDPLMVIRLREKLDAYLKAGGTLLLSSHILSEVEKVCSRIAILHEGILVEDGAVDGLLREFGSIEAVFTAKVKGARL